MEIAFLGSSSGGNSALVCGDETNILIDSGLSARVIERRLDILGRSPNEISAILLSHEHMDHCRGSGILSRKHGIPVMANQPTLAMAPIGNVHLREFITMEPFKVGELEINSYPVPHNAAEPVCFSIFDGRQSIGYATDLGKVTMLLERALFDRDLLVIEANHDEQMLRKGSYPEFLKRSISSPSGHLSNRMTGSAAAKLATDRTRRVILAHLSEENNTPELATHEVRRSLVRNLISTEVSTAERSCITPYYSLD